MGNNAAIIAIILLSVTIISSLRITNDITVINSKLHNAKITASAEESTNLKSTVFPTANVPSQNDENKSDMKWLENASESKEKKEKVAAEEANKQRKKIMKMRYIPFAYHNVSMRRANSSVEDDECLPNSSEDFPKDLFTMEQKRKGAVILHLCLAIYCFTLIAVVCNDYFLPSVECICTSLNLSEDIAAATFMAIATSAPEFFVNCVGTFVTESDIGVGTVVGSAMFNTLGVAALGGLAASKQIKIHWWPLTRDSLIYVIAVSMLVLMCRDEKIEWYEAMVLLIFYLIYFCVMWANGFLLKQVRKLVAKFRKRTILTKEQNCVSSITSISEDVSQSPSVTDDSPMDVQSTDVIVQADQQQPKGDEAIKVWSMPEGTFLKKLWFWFSWPVRLLLSLTIPDCRRHPKIYPLTFFMCVVWIGTNSYLVSWMITVIGNTLGVPDFVMGLTFLAAGGCLPEAISICIVSRKGQGGMGVSNSLGANTLDILLCLGLPWFIKTMINSSKTDSSISLSSGSLFYTILALILAVLALYATICGAGYNLNRKVGFILITIYIIFLTVAIWSEINWMAKASLEPCEFA